MSAKINIRLGLPPTALWLFGLLALCLLLPTHVLAMNANNSFWLKNISESASDKSPRNPDSSPEIITIGSTVHTMWIVRKADWSGYELRYRRSTDGGKTWQPIQVLHSTATNIEQKAYRKMAVSGDTVHIFQNDYGSSESCIWFGTLVHFRSTDNGASFEPARNLVTAECAHHIREIYATASGSEVSVAYEYERNWETADAVNVLLSSDNGANFSTSRAAYFWKENEKPYNLSPTILDMQREGDKIYITYTNGYYYYGLQWSYLFLSASSDGGKTWINNILSVPSKNGEHKSLATQDYHYVPKIAMSGDNVYVVWTGYDRDDEVHLFLRKSINNGKTFAKAVNLTKGKIPSGAVLKSGHETVAAKGQKLYVVYTQPLPGATEIRLIRSLDSGTTFKASKRLNQDSTVQGGGWWPVIRIDPASADGSRLHVLYTCPSYTYSEDSGQTFTGPVRLALERCSFEGPQIAIDDAGAAHTISAGVSSYYGKFDADNDIFYRRYHPVTAIKNPVGNKALSLTQIANIGDGTGTERFDTMQIPASPDVELTRKITIEAWIKPNRRAEDEAYFIFKDCPTSWGAYMLGQWRSGVADARIETTTGYYAIFSEASLPNGKWAHVAMTYDADAGDNNFNLYVNGNLAASATATGALRSVNNAPVLIGGGSYWGYANNEGQPYGVVIDELRFWKRALPQSEIKSKMNKELTGLEFGLSAYYNFNEPISPYGTIRDITNHGNHGVLTYKESLTKGVVRLPLRPSSLAATSVSSSAITLNWKDNSNNETQFQVFRRINSGSWQRIATLDANKTGYKDATASGNDATKGYSYAVAACNADGCSARSLIAVVPFKPSGITATAGKEQITLGWTDNSANETGFLIQRKAGGCTSSNAWTDRKTTAANITTYTDSGLTSGNQYAYRLRAFKRSASQPYAYGNSGWTACISRVAR